MTDAMLLQEPTPVLDDKDSERVHHIINERQPGNSIVDAGVFGTEVTALCGHKFIPTRDPERFPVCQACKAALAALS